MPVESVSEARPGNVIVKYDTEVCGVYNDITEALARIRRHHFVEDDPNEAQYFEFYGVIGKARSPIGSKPEVQGVYDALGRRVIHGNAVVAFGNLLKR